MALLLTAALASAARGADIALPDGWKGSLHGFALLNYSARLDGRSSPSRDGLGEHGVLLGDQRMQLKLEARSPKGPASLFAKPEFFYDAVDETFDANLREGYLDVAYDRWDLRVGRQIITWGVGDLVFINDVFPKDYGAFFAGRPLLSAQ